MPTCLVKYASRKSGRTGKIRRSKERSGHADVPGEDRKSSLVNMNERVEASERANAPIKSKERPKKYEVRTVEVMLICLEKLRFIRVMSRKSVRRHISMPRPRPRNEK